jgi:hypothetical protein
LLLNAAGLRLAFQFESRIDGRQPAAGFGCVAIGSRAGFEQPVVISVVDIPLGDHWELRASGLWAEQVCEQPFVHWSFGLEAFALAIDEPDELLRRGYGHRVPLGWELDFVATSEPARQGDEVSQRGNVEGLLLTIDREIAVDGPALRAYWAESPPGFTAVEDLAHSRQPSGPAVAVLPTMAGPWAVR